MTRNVTYGAKSLTPIPISRYAGFTLLELLVVILIIGLLAAIVTPRYFEQLGKSNTKIARVQIHSLGKALDQYRLDVGHFPSTEQGLKSLFTKPNDEEKWQGPYLVRAVPPDPWGREFIYKSPGDHDGYDISSLGADGQVGGTGENTDVGSWMAQ